MKTILQHIKTPEIRKLAVLIDPDKFNLKNASQFIDKANKYKVRYLFIGGIRVEKNATERLIKVIKPLTQLLIVLFPRDVTQVTNEADALLFLSLVSGRNPEYLIGKHIKSVSKLRSCNLESIPTGLF